MAKNAGTPKRTKRIDLETIIEAKASIDEFLDVVDRGELDRPTPRDTAVLRRLQGASDAFGAIIESP